MLSLFQCTDLKNEFWLFHLIFDLLSQIFLSRFLKGVWDDFFWNNFHLIIYLLKFFSYMWCLTSIRFYFIFPWFKQRHRFALSRTITFYYTFPDSKSFQSLNAKLDPKTGSFLFPGWYFISYRNFSLLTFIS